MRIFTSSPGLLQFVRSTHELKQCGLRIGNNVNWLFPIRMCENLGVTLLSLGLGTLLPLLRLRSFIPLQGHTELICGFLV